MICKYCHEKNHLIDNCPNIICKKCNKQGHPQWLCSDKKYDKKHKNNFDNNNIDNNINNNLIPKSSFERKQNSINTNNNVNMNTNSNNNINNINNTNNINNLLKEEKNISYYLKLEKERWGNIIFNE